jgi:hypothetical protein
MLLTRGIFPQNQGARSGSREVYHGISSTLQHSWSVRDCSNLIVAGVESRRRKGEVSLSITRFACSREGLFSGLDRLKIGVQAPMNSGVAEGLASVMEGCV